MGSKWFGRECNLLSAQWECEEDKEHGCAPVLTFCNHKDSPEDTEGNCRKEICPLLPPAGKLED